MKTIYIVLLILLPFISFSQNPEIEFPKIHSGKVSMVKFANDGKLMATSSADSTILVWETNPLKVKGRLKGHAGDVNCIDFSPDGSLIASGSNDGTIILWDANNVSKIWSSKVNNQNLIYLPANAKIQSVSFSLDGNFLIAGANSNKILLFNVSNRGNIYPSDKFMRKDFYNIQFVRFLNDNDNLVVADREKGLRFFYTEWNELKDRLGQYQAPDYYAFALSKSRSKLVGTLYGKLKVYSVPDRKELSNFKDLNFNLLSAEFSPDENFILTCTYDGNIKMWDWKSGKEVHNYKIPFDAVAKGTSATFSPDSKYVVAGFRDGSVRLWPAIYQSDYLDLPVQQALQVNLNQTKDSTSFSKIELILPVGHTNKIYHSEFNDRNTLLLSAGADKTILWDVNTGKPLWFYNSENTETNYSVFEDNFQSVTTYQNQMKYVWDVYKGNLKNATKETAVNSTESKNPMSSLTNLFGGSSKVITAKKFKCEYNLSGIKIYDSNSKIIFNFNLVNGNLIHAENEVKKDSVKNNMGGLMDAIKLGAEIEADKMKNNQSKSSNAEIDGKKKMQKEMMEKFKINLGGNIKTSMDPREYKIINIQFTPDEQYILIDYNKKWPELWNINTSKLEYVLKPVDFDPKDSLFTTNSNLSKDSQYASVFVNGTMVSAGSHDGFSFELKNKKEKTSFKCPVQHEKTVEISDDESLIMISGTSSEKSTYVSFKGGEDIMYYNITENKFLSDKFYDNIFIEPNRNINWNLSFIGKSIIPISLIQSVCNDKVGIKKEMLPDNGNSLNKLFYNKENKQLELLFSNASYMVWDNISKKIVSNVKLIDSYSQDHFAAIDFSISKDKNFIGFTVSNQKTVYLYDKQKKAIVFTYRFNNDYAHISLLPDNKRAFAWNTDSIIYFSDIFNTDGTSEIKRFGKGDAEFQSIFPSNDGKYFILTNSNNTLQLINTYTGMSVFKTNANALNFKGTGGLFSENSERVCIANNNIVNVIECKSGQILKSFPVLGKIEFLNLAKDRVITSDKAQIRFYSFSQAKELVSLILLGENNYMFLMPDLKYYGTKEAARELSYVKDLKRYSFDQFDVKNNRPDKVLEAIGSVNIDLITSLKLAYQKRIEKLEIDTTSFDAGFDVPVADFENRNKIAYEQSNGQLTLHLKGSDKNSKLDRFNVWVNAVPVFGARGISIRSLRKNDVDTTITVMLSQGKNQITTSVTNVNGTESYRMPLNVNYIPAIPKIAKLYFIGIGVQHYKDESMNLTYAAKDIRDLAAAYKNHFPNCIIDTLIDENATEENILQIKRKLLKTNVDDKVVISVSGHGLLNSKLDFYYGTYNVNFQHPEKDGLLYDNLEGLLDGIPARNKLLLVDACHSGEVDKQESKLLAEANPNFGNGLAKGVRTIIPKGVNIVVENNSNGLQNSFELMQQLFADLSKGSGAVVISAAGGKEFAFEADKWNNGVFTYSVLKCFEEKGNIKDGIKVSELKDYVTDKVSTLTNGHQKPTSRKENLENDFRVW